MKSTPPTVVHGSFLSAHIPQDVACRVVVSQTQKLLHSAIPDPSEPSLIPLRIPAECDDAGGRLQPRPRCRPLGRALMLPKVYRRPGLVPPPREAVREFLALVHMVESAVRVCVAEQPRCTAVCAMSGLASQEERFLLQCPHGARLADGREVVEASA